jgi:ABC-2 type transport system permease protein
VRLLRSVMLYGVSDLASLAPGLALMMGWGVVTFAISLWVFKWHE